MKYKRLLVLVTCLFFLTVTAICFFALFKVADITVMAEIVNGSTENIVSVTEDGVKKYKSKNLVFLNEENLREELESKTPYLKVESIKKTYPNVLSVKVTERQEVFCIKNGGNYYALTSDFYCVAKKADNLNNVDGKRNIIINCSLSDYSNDALSVGKTFGFNDKITQQYILSALNSFADMRDDLLSVTVKVKENSFYNRQIVLKMTEGVEIVLDNANVKTLEKINFAYDYYRVLDNKSVGLYIVTVSATSGECIISQG